MFGSVGIWEVLFILLIVAVLFGGKKIPELGKGLGEGIKNFKNAIKKEKVEDGKTSTDDSNN